jgi:hypothetical protein
MRYWPGCTKDPKWIAEFLKFLREYSAVTSTERRGCGDPNCKDPDCTYGSGK